MNNKGFTLVELLVTVVILALIGGIAVNRVVSTINSSKKKSEEVFLDRVGTYIESYINYKGSELSSIEGNVALDYEKCKNGVSDSDSNSDCYYVTVNELESKTLRDIVNSDLKIVSADDLMNPSNKEKCTNLDTTIRIFKDTDRVYYYYVNMVEAGCDFSIENQIVTNLPSSLCSEINKKDSDINCGGNDEE